MKTLERNEVTLAYEDNASELSPIIFVHGWSCDHTVFASQSEFFNRSHRVISVDLRGHGASDAPIQDYTMESYADDLAWMCGELGWIKPIVVGHSMGGNIALELASRHPQVASSIVMIDSVVFPSQAFRDALYPIMDALRSPDYISVCQFAMRSTCLPTDEEPRKTELVLSLPKAPQHVLISALKNHLLDYDSTPAASGCHLPVAYIGAAVSTVDLVRFRYLTPQLVTAQIIGSGHFSPIFVPDQINAMIGRFLRVYSTSSADVQAE